jgi:serine/threonine-protein kinase RsbW
VAEIDLTLQDCLASLVAVQERLAAWLPNQGVALAESNRIRIVFEEVATNIMKYAHADGGQGLHRIEAALRIQDGAALLVVEDDGAAFDPRSVKPKPLEGPLEDQALGGLGLLMVGRIALGLDYRRTAQGRNRVEIRLVATG